MKRILLLLIAVMFSFGCQGGRKEDPLEHGYQLIDREEYSAAIDYLEELSTHDDRDHVRMALASAYAGRAGLKIEKFWNFAQIMRAEQINEETVVNQPLYIHNKNNIKSFENFLPENVRSNLDNMLRLMASLEAYKTRFDIYPYIEKNKRNDLDRGISVLTNIPNEGGRIYRAVLNSVIIRSELDDGFDVWNSIQEQFANPFHSPTEFIRVFCTPVTGDLTNWMNNQFNRSEAITEDLRIAFPSQREELRTFDTSLEDLQNELPEMQRVLIPGDCRVQD